MSTGEGGEVGGRSKIGEGGEVGGRGGVCGEGGLGSVNDGAANNAGGNVNSTGSKFNSCIHSGQQEANAMPQLQQAVSPAIPME